MIEHTADSDPRSSGRSKQSFDAAAIEQTKVLGVVVSLGRHGSHDCARCVSEDIVRSAGGIVHVLEQFERGHDIETRTEIERAHIALHCVDTFHAAATDGFDIANAMIQPINACNRNIAELFQEGPQKGAATRSYVEYCLGGETPENAQHATHAR
jgi:hypothetical protein